MAQMGKIFIYENNPETLANFNTDFKARGFITFGTDNIYQFLKYAALVHPDIVIMNIPHGFKFNDTFWQTFQTSLRQENCPEIYINIKPPLAQNKTLHLTNFMENSLSSHERINFVHQSHNHLLN